MSAGCGVHHAEIRTRDGALIAHADALTEVSWSRKLDSFGTAEVTIMPGGNCCEGLSHARAWWSTLHIWRNGVYVWGGPVTAVQWSVDSVKIAASDILGWLARRVVHTDQSYDADLTTIAAGLISDGFAPDDPGHEVEILSRARVEGHRRFYKDTSIVLDDLEDLADTGLDFTAVGSKILLMGEDHCERVGTLSDADFPQGLTITDDGASTASRWIVHGGTTGGGEGRPPVIGTADGGYIPLIEQLVTEQSIRTEADAVRAARSRLNASHPVPLYVDTSQEKTLSPDAAVDVPLLVPGWCLDVRSTATCRPLSTTLKIQSVKVSEKGSSGGDGGEGGESVAVQLAPPGGGGEDLGAGMPTGSTGVSNGV